MTNQKKPGDMSPFDGNILQIFGERLRLILRLMGDGRVNPLLKLLPIGSLIYTIWPLDIPGPIDDAAILMMANYMFVEMCPPEIVEEHLNSLRSSSNSFGGWLGGFKQNPPPPPPPVNDENVVDAEFKEVKKDD